MTSYNVAHQLGHLQLHADTGAIVTSGGDLQNDQKTAGIIFNIVKSLVDVEKLQSVSVHFQSSCYVIVVSGNKIHVVKKESHQ